MMDARKIQIRRQEVGNFLRTWLTTKLEENSVRSISVRTIPLLVILGRQLIDSWFSFFYFILFSFSLISISIWWVLVLLCFHDFSFFHLFQWRGSSFLFEQKMHVLHSIVVLLSQLISSSWKTWAKLKYIMYHSCSNNKIIKNQM